MAKKFDQTLGGNRQIFGDTNFNRSISPFTSVFPGNYLNNNSGSLFGNDHKHPDNSKSNLPAQVVINVDKNDNPQQMTSQAVAT